MHQVCVVLQVCQVRRSLLEQPAVAPGKGVGVAVTDPCADAIDGVVSAVEALVPPRQPRPASGRVGLPVP